MYAPGIWMERQRREIGARGVDAGVSLAFLPAASALTYAFSSASAFARFSSTHLHGSKFSSIHKRGRQTAADQTQKAQMH